MKSLESELADLIYLDPPFFSNRNYVVIWDDEGEICSFKDRRFVPVPKFQFNFVRDTDHGTW